MNEEHSLVVEAQNDWADLFKPAQEYNWREFTLIKLYVEDDRSMGMMEAQVALLGFHLRVVYTYDWNTPTRLQIKKMIAGL